MLNFEQILANNKAKNLDVYVKTVSQYPEVISNPSIIRGVEKIRTLGLETDEGFSTFCNLTERLQDLCQEIKSYERYGENARPFLYEDIGCYDVHQDIIDDLIECLKAFYELGYYRD